MKILHKFDKNGFYVEDVLIDDDDNFIPDDCTNEPMPQPIFTPKWTGTEWIDNITDDVLLDQAKANKKAELDSTYNQTLLNGFKVTISGVEHTLGWTTDDKTNLNATQTAIERGFWQFPLYYSDINGDPLLLSSQADLDIIEQTASKFFPNQHQQILTLKANVQSAETVDEVNAIVWVEANY